MDRALETVKAAENEKGSLISIASWRMVHLERKGYYMQGLVHFDPFRGVCDLAAWKMYIRPL